MPLEPYSWDRRDSRKHDGGGAGGPHRWRDHSFPHHHHQFNNNNNNYHGGTAPPRWDLRYRPSPGYGKQGNRQFYMDEFGHGLMNYRPNEKMIEDDSCRASGSGRYGRYSREYRGWKVDYSEMGSRPSGSGRFNNMSEQRSVDVMTSPCTPNSDYVNSRDRSLLKYQNGSDGVVGCLGSAGQKLERGNSLNPNNWKPVKWNPPESLSVGNSGFSHASSSKRVEPGFGEMKMESMQKNVVPVSSPPRAAAAAETYNDACEETASLKKPRLGFGQGLAKYEKVKVESPDEPRKNGATTSCSNLEPLHSGASNLVGESHKLEMVSECASPATPVSSSSSPGLEDKMLMKAASIDHDSAHIFKSMSVTQDNPTVESYFVRSFNLEELDVKSISHLNSSIEELLQSDNPTVESSFVRSTAMNKLLLLKNNITKAVETAETEIELLENELKSMISELESSDDHLNASSSVSVACLSKPYEDYSAASNDVLRPVELQVVTDSDAASKDDHLPGKDVDIDSPSSATSKSIEVSLNKDVSTPEMLGGMEVTVDPDLDKSNLEMELEADHLVEENYMCPSSDGTCSELIGCRSISSVDDILDFYGEEYHNKLRLVNKRDCEQLTSEVIHKLLPANGYYFDFPSVVKDSSVQNDLVKERFSRKKYHYKLKEKVLTLKFKMLRHSWKEDMHNLSLQKLRGKIQKKFDLSSWKANSSYQKHPPSIRSRCSFTGLSLAASTELLRYASRLLAEPQVKPLRCALKMPPMIVDRKERMITKFISYNGIVEDPLAIEKDRSNINPWSPEDKELFIDKLAVFGKDFRKISSFFDNRTTSECVEFYYKNHKSDAFKRANKPEYSKQSTPAYLLTSGNRCNREDNSISLEILGTASAFAAKIDGSGDIQQKHTPKSLSMSGGYKMESGGDNLLDRSSSLCLNNNEREAVAADVLAGICGSLSSEAMSSCITSSLDPGEGYQDQKCQRMGSSTRQPLTPDVTQNVAETCSDESCEEMDPTYWTDEEKSLLIQAVSSYGKDFTLISRCMKTKTRDQCKVFFSKARKCLGLDKICSETENLLTDDDNRDRGGVCSLETSSMICNGKPHLRRDDDIASGKLKFGHNPLKVSITPGKPDLNGSEEIVVVDTNFTYTLTSKVISPDDQGMVDNFELALDGNDLSRNSGEVVSNMDVAHAVGQANVENLPNLVENEDNAVVYEGTQRNGSSTKATLDLDVADDAGRAGQANLQNLPKLLETETQTRHSNTPCIEVPDAKPHVEGCSCESNRAANLIKTKGTCTRCSLHDDHLEVHLAGSDFVQRTRELDVVEKPLVLQQPGSSLADLGSSNSTTKHGKRRYDGASVVPEKMRDERRVEYCKMDDHHLPRTSLLEQNQSTCKVEHYPLGVSTIKEISSDVSCKRLIPNGVNVPQHFGRDFNLQRCHSRKSVSSDDELASVPHEGDPSCSRFHINKLSTNGHVKLFGQVLSRTSHHKPARVSEDCGSQHHSVGSESSSIKCSSSQQTVDVLSSHIKHGHNNIGNLDDPPPRNISLRDQNRIPSGSSTLHDSTILLARYPTAFSNYAAPSSKLELPPLNTSKLSECSLNGVPTFSNKDVSVNNDSADLHHYQNQEMQSFSFGRRHSRHDHLLAQMQRRNGFDVVPGVAMNVVGRGTVLGSQFVGVSDPVVAMRMHYAKSEQQQFSGGHLIGEDDPWMSKGSVGM